VTDEGCGTVDHLRELLLCDVRVSAVSAYALTYGDIVRHGVISFHAKGNINGRLLCDFRHISMQSARKYPKISAF
jgi:hypothetical protein